MIEKSLVEKVYKTLLNEPTVEKGYDFYSCLGDTDRDDLHAWNLMVQKVIKSCMKSAPESEINDWYELYVSRLSTAHRDTLSNTCFTWRLTVRRRKGFILPGERL